MLRNLLPNELQKTAIHYHNSEKCCYDTGSDTIFYNRKKLLKDKILKLSVCNYFQRALTNKEYILICLLHELGHRKRFIEKKMDLDIYFKEKRQVEYKQKLYHLSSLDNHLNYWEYIKEEKEAMKFAKKYFASYLELQKKNETN